ncbi:YHS domain-containing (seleno)protein [uncultured Psychroserpens sp.]|uniref:YHS domain-containing (seleno)protein n=1 Tax=uncultured Psychroserpens sp. TaxID=255436 RepID=UPI00262F061B|nr:YHS domain-containing (seleno)protein [uncultured Psychroserpens sp.]
MKQIIFLFSLICFTASWAQNNRLVGKSFYNVDDNNLALKGYDPVSYFDGEPKKGNSEITYEYEGLIYNFIGKANLKAFKKSPEKFLPQYGGYCAFGLGAPSGKYGFNPQRFDVNPESYLIKNEKLYLFFKNPSFDAKSFWMAEPEKNMLQQADSIWKVTEDKYKGLKIPFGMSAKAPPETLQMAFLVGNWEVNYKQKRNDGTYSETKGRWYGQFTPDGMSIIDYWGKGMPVQGINVRTYDANLGKWSMTWVQNNTLGNKALIEGELVSEKMIFQTKYWELDPSGQYLNRITFYNVTNNSFQYHIDTSVDGGKNWIEKTTIIEASRSANH